MVELIGVYEVNGHPNVHLLEFEINAKHTEIELGKFTQAQEGVDRLDWQTPWDEKFLNDAGTEVIGDWLNEPNDLTDKTRLVFFFHLLDFKMHLETPFGEVYISKPKLMPDRLTAILDYERPD